MGLLDEVNKNKNEQAKTAGVSGEVSGAVDKTPETPPPAATKVEEYLYATPLSESFSIHLDGGEVKAKDGLIKLNPTQHKELQKLLGSGRPDISQNVVLLDPAAAEKIAREHMEKHKPEAHKGGASSISNAERQPITTEASKARAQAVLANAKEEEAIHAGDTQIDPETGKAVGEPFKE